MANDGEHPNINLFPLEKVENGIYQAVIGLHEVEPTDGTQLKLKNMCLADLKEFQDGSLLALRRSLE